MDMVKQDVLKPLVLILAVLLAMCLAHMGLAGVPQKVAKSAVEPGTIITIEKVLAWEDTYEDYGKKQQKVISMKPCVTQTFFVTYGKNYEIVNIIVKTHGKNMAPKSQLLK